MKKSIRAAKALSVFALAAFLTTGCGGSAPDVSGLTPVKGTVTQNQAPLAGASVVFYPLGDTKGTFAVGVTDDAGNYELEMVNLGKGAFPGAYKVTVGKLVMPDGSPIPAGTETIAELNPKQLLPPAVSNQDQTKLTANVTQAGDPINFEIGKEVAGARK